MPLEEALPEILKKAEVDRLLMVRERKLNRAEPDENPAAGPWPKALAKSMSKKARNRRNRQAKLKQAQGPSAGQKARNRRKNLKRLIANLQAKLDGDKGNGRGSQKEPKGKSKGKGKADGKAKGQGKEKGKGPGRKRSFCPMPHELIVLDSSDENGERICFDAALSKCNKAKWGERCPKGWHKCMAPGCKQLHAYVGNH